MQSNCPRRDYNKSLNAERLIFSDRESRLLPPTRKAQSDLWFPNVHVYFDVPISSLGLHFFLISVLNEKSTGLCSAITSTIKAVFNF